jgi:hypothetical protein
LRDFADISTPPGGRPQDREALAANPLVTLHQGPEGVGHGVYDVPDGEALVAGAVEAALRAAG